MAEYQILVPPPKRFRRTRLIVIVIVALAAVGAGAYIAGKHLADPAHPSTAPGAGTPTTIGARALTVVSSVPANGATDVPSNQVVTLHLSAPVAASSAMPAFDPPVAGSWATGGPGLALVRRYRAVHSDHQRVPGDPRPDARACAA